MTPLQLYYSHKSAFVNVQVCRSLFRDNTLVDDLLQPWRAFTTFFYFGSISLDFVFHMFFLYVCHPSPHPGMANIDRLDSMRYSRMLEESSFANRTADYFWLLLLSAFMLLVSQADGIGCTQEFIFHSRLCHLSSISPSSHLLSHSSPSISGHVATHPHQYRCSAYSPFRRHICQ